METPQMQAHRHIEKTPPKKVQRQLPTKQQEEITIKDQQKKSKPYSKKTVRGGEIKQNILGNLQ